MLVSVDQYRSLSLPFYADYAAKHDGRRPFVNPGPLLRWAWGQNNGGDAAYGEALKNKTIFKDWWESDGYGKADDKTCSEVSISILTARVKPSIGIPILSE